MKKILVIAAAVLVLISMEKNRLNAEGNKRILMVVPPVQIMDVEYNESRKVFDAKSANVKVASTTMDIVSGEKLVLKPDLLISQAKASDYDVIVLIGGMGIFQHILGNTELQLLVKQMFAQNKYVCAICGTPAVLAKAGILKNVKATIYPDAGLIARLKDGGALYVTDSVVISGKIVTARGPEVSSEFAKVVSKIIGL